MERTVIGITGQEYEGSVLIWEESSLYVEISPDGEMTDVTNRGDPRPGVRAQSGARLYWKDGYLTSNDVGWEDRGGGNAHRRFVPTTESKTRLNKMTPAQFKKARRDLGLSTSQVGFIMNVTDRTVRKWEYEDGTRPPSPMACRIMQWIMAGWRPPEFPKGLRD